MVEDEAKSLVLPPRHSGHVGRSMYKVVRRLTVTVLIG